MRFNYKKSFKFVTLLLSALIIATASAAIYDYMFLNGNVGVEGMSLAWISGADGTDAGTSISGDGLTATLASLKGPPNGTRTYADPVRVNNTGGSAVAFDVLVDAVSGDTTELDSIYVRIYSNTTGLSIQNVTVWVSGAKGSDVTGLSIPASNIWRFQWEITWKSTATVSDSVTVNLKLKVTV